MCGLAGIIDLCGRRSFDRGVVEHMADAIRHRGPDDNGALFEPGIGVCHRRLSIVGLADGQQPIYNEDRSVAVMYNGELFDYPEQRKALEAKGHVFRTHTDTEVLVHLYEEHGEDVFAKLNGQFAFLLIDFRQRQMFLARDRVGICPMHWSRQGDEIYFGSEIKALLASGAVPPAVDPRGMDHIFTFFAMPTRRTMFAGVQSVLPGHYLKIAMTPCGSPAEIVERQYWDLDFPDAGDEERPENEARLVDHFEETFRHAVDIRLRADVPVVSYLSGGVDSGMVLATASAIRGTPLPSFTVGVSGDPKLDETTKARVAANHVGSDLHVVEADADLISSTYPNLIEAADSPVVDTSCAGLLRLAGAVSEQGYKVALTGEGADEALAGYAWFKMAKIVRSLDVGGFQPSRTVSRTLRRILPPQVPFAQSRNIDELIGGPHAQSVMYSLMSASGSWFFSDEMKERLDQHNAYEDLVLNRERMAKWHPLNQSLYFGYKTMLPGLLLNHKGDRVAMANSVETRYPFLDKDLIALSAGIDPSYKLRGARYDKYLLRQAAARVLPSEIALRPKAMFRAPFAESFFVTPPEYVRELLSERSLKETGYFDVKKVRNYYAWARRQGFGSQIFFLGMGLASILATQLWHHKYLGGGLCSLPESDCVGGAMSRHAREPTSVSAGAGQA